MKILKSQEFLKMVTLIGITMPFSFFGCSGVQKSYISRVEREFATQPLVSEEKLTEADIKHMPLPVRKYLAYTGVLGKNKLQNIRIEFEELMYKKPDAKPMISSSEQYNFFSRPARHFFMKASMMGIPFRVLHSYSEEKATMLVKVLNDLCILAPAGLIHKNIKWEEIDSFSSKILFENGKYKVSAILYFNEKGELVNFVSDDRSALQDDGTLRKARWSTPLKDYKEFNGIKLPTYGEAIWNYPEGDFVYGKFYLKKVDYNLKGFVSE